MPEQFVFIFRGSQPSRKKGIAATLPSDGVPLEWLKRYSSPKPLRRAPTPKGKKSE